MQTETRETTAGNAREEWFAALTHGQRRRVLDALGAAEGSLTVTDLASEFARRTDREADPERVERLRVVLYHWHLPRLAEAGLVEFDRSEKTAALSSAPCVAKPDGAPGAE